MAILTITETITIEVITCANCGVKYGIESEFRKRKRQTHDEFYCPNGHSNYYPQETEAERLRKELKNKEQELSEVVIEKINLQNKVLDQKRQLGRVHNGVCPCCNRTFKNLQRHMKTKHPEISSK